MENGVATAMAIGGRSLRLCDACGRERARWYCKADEAYLCERCDSSVHGANAVSLRHERFPLGPAGMLMKQQAITDHDPPKTSEQGLNKRQKSGRSASKEVLEDPTDSFLVHTPDEEEPPRQVPVFDPLHDESLPNTPEDDFLGFTVPCCTASDPEADDAGCTDSLEDKCFPGGESPEFCDMNSFMTMEDILMDSSGSHFQGELRKVKEEEEEGDELDQIKLEVDEMLGIAFSAEAVKEEEEEVHESVVNKITLKLDYEDVLNAWSDRGPFWTEGPRPQTVPDDFSFDPRRMLDHDMGSEFCTDTSSELQAEVPVVNFSDERGDPSAGREARVMRYKEKRRTRLFSKTIRYEVRKLNAERRPRLKGRFVKRAVF